MSGRRIDPETRLRRTCPGFPEVTERLSHSAPTWFYKGQKSFLMLLMQGRA